MQNSLPISVPRFMLLSPAALAIAFAVLAFIRGLVVWIVLSVHHARFGAAHPMHGYNRPGLAMHGPGTGLLWWLGSIIVAAVVGALLAWIYNLIATRFGRAAGPSQPAAAAPNA